MAMNLIHQKIEDAAKELAKVEVPEWIWVDGYKGTDKDMKCRGYQFELGKQFDMPEGAKIELCDSGFHFCTKLKDVFNHYPLGCGNRFFKVSALVRAKKNETDNPFSRGHHRLFNDSKETSKSIIFTKELTIDEILADGEKELARDLGIIGVLKVRKITTLEDLGYAHEVAEIIVNDFGKYDEAYALAQQKDISMDTRILALFCNRLITTDIKDEFMTRHFNISTLGVDLSKKN